MIIEKKFYNKWWFWIIIGTTIILSTFIGFSMTTYDTCSMEKQENLVYCIEVNSLIDELNENINYINYLEMDLLKMNTNVNHIPFQLKEKVNCSSLM